ncbi:hypothetical protein IF1G_01193 [Cordyceps javanica]|uniref:DUF7730 domain-containing protein n=1 Tax=Cordyceps javanica TaxID=43265 RepID=A0A545WF30_9HYPO|nr:hypothetical protein IF1G_01193 [Cordyceps javanica]TQW12415.1 hypothetical protein IF2G_01146 [Cordyceps javanica]
MTPFGDSLRRLRDRVFLSEDARRKAAIHTVPPLPPSPPASAVIAAPALSATACSALFQRLPGEVRQRILVAAFGDRLLHVHLSLERPVLHTYRKSSKSSKSREGHAGHPARYTFDDAARPFWRWRSSCCHSHCFHHESWRWREPRQSDQFREKDCCVSGEGCGHPGAPETCFIGAAGWLRTCRQAYLEGYTVLYRTNTVRLHGTFMFAHLPELFPRLSLDSLTLVSLCWDMGWSREYPRRLRLGDHPEEYSFLEGLDQLLGRLPLTIPNVKSLHLSLHGAFGAGEQWTAYGTRCEVVFQQTEALLHRVLAQVLKLPNLTDFRLALPRSMFMPWLQEVLDITLQFEEAIWAELPAEWLRRDIPADLMASDEKRAAIDSFWVLLGASDLPPLTIRCFC